MFVIKRIEHITKHNTLIESWQIGHYDPNGKWEDFDEALHYAQAGKACHYLNGGSGKHDYPGYDEVAEQQCREIGRKLRVID